jgi:hypothetical protein
MSTIDVFATKVPQRVIRSLAGLPYTATYKALAAVDFGAGDSTPIIFGTPANLRALILAVDVYNVSETFNSVTTAARVEVGDGANADEFVLTSDFEDGTDGQSFTTFDGTIVTGVQQIVEPDDQVTVTCVAPTGGTPTGIAEVSVTVLYFD